MRATRGAGSGLVSASAASSSPPGSIATALPFGGPMISRLSEGAESAMSGRPVLSRRRSKIYHDLAVQAFLEGLLREPLTVDEMRRRINAAFGADRTPSRSARSEEHTSELQSLMRISYAVFCLKKQ